MPFNVQAVLENFIIQRPDLFVEEGVADEFFAKMEALVKFSEDTKDIFKVVAVDDQIGAGVDIIELPKVKLGLYSHCLFRWNPPLFYSVKEKDIFFEHNKEHPIAT